MIVDHSGSALSPQSPVEVDGPGVQDFGVDFLGTRAAADAQYDK